MKQKTKTILILLIIAILITTITAAAYIHNQETQGQVWTGHITDFLTTEPNENDITTHNCPYCNITTTYYNQTILWERWWNENNIVKAIAHGKLKQIDYPIPWEGTEGVDATRFTCEEKDGSHTMSFFIKGDITQDYEAGDNIIITLTKNECNSLDGFTWDYPHTSTMHPDVVLYTGYTKLLPSDCIELSDIDYL